MTRVEHVDELFVARHRANRAGWASIARMAGVSEGDLRRKFEAGFRAADWPMSGRPAARPAPRETVRLGLIRAGFTDADALMLARLWQANGGRVLNQALTEGIAGGSASTDAAREMRRAAIAKGIAFEKPKASGFCLAAEGVVKVEVLAGLRDASGRRVE